MKSSPETLAEQVVPFLVNEAILAEGDIVDKDWLAKAVKTLQERSKTLVELASSLRYYFADPAAYDEKARTKFLNDKGLQLLAELRSSLNELHDYTHDGIRGSGH